jgi:predicted transcriptional regulator
MRDTQPEEAAAVEFAARLRAELDRSDLTITEAAAKARVHYNTLQSYLHGTRLPRKPALVRLRRIFPALRDLT